MRFRMARLSPQLQASSEEGLELCRSGDWTKGLLVLASVLDQRTPSDQVPGIVYSYLGYGVARFQGKQREGLKLCEHSLKIQYYEADNHWNLARVQALAGERLAALLTVDHGLKLDPSHQGLIEAQRELGVRKKPMIGFLSRENPLNVFLGRLRHSIKEGKSDAPPSRPLPKRPVGAASGRSTGSIPAAKGGSATPTPQPRSAASKSPPSK